MCSPGCDRCDNTSWGHRGSAARKGGQAWWWWWGPRYSRCKDRSSGLSSACSGKSSSFALLNDFFQLNSSPNISQKEITQEKQRLQVYQEFPGSPWHTAHINQFDYKHFTDQSGYPCYHSCCSNALLQSDYHRVTFLNVNISWPNYQLESDNFMSKHKSSFKSFWGPWW